MSGVEAVSPRIEATDGHRNMITRNLMVVAVLSAHAPVPSDFLTNRSENVEPPAVVLVVFA